MGWSVVVLAGRLGGSLRAGRSVTGRSKPKRWHAEADLLAGELRENIYSGEWADGHELSSEAEMVRQHGIPLQTLRKVIDDLAWEGLIEKVQGRRSRVSYREPDHRLVIGAGQAPLGQVAEPPAAFMGLPDSRIGRECWQRRDTVPRHFAALLGMPDGEEVVERSILLKADGRPLLVSTSYLPAELADDASWQEVEVGQLAGGSLAVEPAGCVEARTRMPRPDERKLLGMTRAAVIVLSRPYVVRAAERDLPAGVVVLARSDQVFLRWGGAPAG